MPIHASTDANATAVPTVYAVWVSAPPCVRADHQRQLPNATANTTMSTQATCRYCIKMLSRLDNGGLMLLRHISSHTSLI